MKRAIKGKNVEKLLKTKLEKILVFMALVLRSIKFDLLNLSKAICVKKRPMNTLLHVLNLLFVDLSQLLLDKFLNILTKLMRFITSTNLSTYLLLTTYLLLSVV